VDEAGEVHAFLLNQWKPDGRGEGERGGPGTYGGCRIDIWHTRTDGGRARWQKPRCIWEGYTGALNSSLLLRSGRLLLPFSYYVPRTWGQRGEGLKAFTFMGMFDSVVLYSDDQGATWRLSNSLTVQTPDITYAYGACEPVAVELADGTAWMLLRTQMGRFYESFSADGASWTQASPSSIVSSDSPAGLVRLGDGRIVLIWNNCQRHPYAYGGRQVLHAAISSDNGRTWRGYREVARDPRRGEPPPPDGDHGTAYPFPVVTADDKVIVSTGQGEGRAVLALLDPQYLLETAQETDFRNGLDDWSLFGTRGVELAPHPSRRKARVLSIRRADAEWPAAAVWNFPAGASGTLRLRLMLQPDSQGLTVGLTDHFSPPFDAEDSLHNLFNVRITHGGVAAGDVALDAGRWHSLRIEWDCGSRRAARVFADGKAAGKVPLQRATPGVSYLRLRAEPLAGELGGTLVESVKCSIENV
jgi:hypothetical protein